MRIALVCLALAQMATSLGAQEADTKDQQTLQSRIEALEQRLGDVEQLLETLQAIDHESAEPTCRWVEVGHDRSFYRNGPWCPNGMAIVALYLDPAVNKRYLPFVKEAYCCGVPEPGVVFKEGTLDTGD